MTRLARQDDSSRLLLLLSVAGESSGASPPFMIKCRQNKITDDALARWLKQDYNMYVKKQGRLGDVVSSFAVATKEYKATPLFDQNKWRR